MDKSGPQVNEQGRNIEIELKARIPEKDKDHLLGKLNENFSFEREFRKEDEYYQGLCGGETKRLRLRYDEKWYLTGKQKTMTAEGVEVNSEWETGVENPAAARELVSYLGLALHYRKRKSGYAFRMGGVTLELCEVNSLGWFLELEVLCESDDGESVAQAKKVLYGMLTRLGIPSSAIEPRFYSQLILGS
ncbi:MAG: class IV adenylate cyclase [Spirochaetales bacterium]|nr:class IV adenylate cyclase [Spirochaetales bacterium]